MATEPIEKDRKAIEEKALLCFKDYIVDSKIISQYIPENDKEPFWDGHIYLFNNPNKNKDSFIGRIPTQVKGTEVKRFMSKKYKFSIDTNDLKAYLHEPTLFIVCQEKENSKERKLFYRDLLPVTVNKIIEGHAKQSSIKVLMHPIPERLKDFEEIALIFYGNSNKQISFADKKPFTMEDVKKNKIKNFSFVAPRQNMNQFQLLKYLSSHENYLYAKLNNDFDIDIPIFDGPMTFAFKQKVNQSISVGGRVFYDGFSNEIAKGVQTITIGNVLTINIPMDDNDAKMPKIKFNSTASILDTAIKDVQFALAIAETGKLSIGDLNFDVIVNDKNEAANLKEQLARWLELKELLEKLHITKAFDLSKITSEQEELIGILISTILHNKPVPLKKPINGIMTAELGNVNLLLWCSTVNNNMCLLGDFFDQSFQLLNESNGIKHEMCSYSYLRNGGLWEWCDNVDFSRFISSYEEIAKKESIIYEMATMDMLAMIGASDKIENVDKERRATLLDNAILLNEWLYNNDPTKDSKPIHFVNKMQIIKRQRIFTNEEKCALSSMIKKDSVKSFVKAGCWLLLDNTDEFRSIYQKLPPEEQGKLKNYPIWRFAPHN